MYCAGLRAINALIKSDLTFNYEEAGVSFQV
jgi:hypothetical protein